MKKYIDIQNLRLEDIELAPEIVRKRNVGAFEAGDQVVIQEKIDGSCASFRYLGEGEFVACSRRKVLDSENNLDGFYQYCEEIAKRLYLNEKACEKNNLCRYFDYDNFIIFGEWTGRRNQVIYDPNPLKQWFVFDIYDLDDGNLLEFKIVKIICGELGLEHVHEIATINDFNTWDSILPFANTNFGHYGNMQEGIIIKNQTKLIDRWQGRAPIYLKIVNEEYREVKRKPNPEKKEKKKIQIEAEKELANIVSSNRIVKCMRKLQEDDLIPKEISDQDLQNVFKHLPKLVIEDVKKEEPEIFELYKNCANRVITRIVVGYVKGLINN